MYYLRLYLAFVILAIISFIMIPVSILRPKHRNNMVDLSTMLTKVMYWFWGVNVEIENEERLTPSQPSIIICNHQDTQDMFFSEIAMRRGTVTLGKWEMIYIPFIGWVFFLAGNILIKRNKKEKANLALSLAAKRLKDQNLSLMIFPEGTRNWGKPLPFKLGAFKLAIEAQSPVQPVCFSLRHKTLDYSKLHSGNIKIKCLAPISTVGLTQDDAVDLAVRCRKLIEAECIKISQ